MIVRGTVKQSTVTTGAQQLQLELLEGETREDVEAYEQAGVSFRAEDDADMLVVELGSASNLAAIGTNARGKRPTVAIEKGEGGLYFGGAYKVFLKQDGSLALGDKDATEAQALGDALKAWLSALTVGTPFGPSTTPLNLASIDTILSPTTKVS